MPNKFRKLLAKHSGDLSADQIQFHHWTGFFKWLPGTCDNFMVPERNEH
jgi:hypothetical protein